MVLPTEDRASGVGGPQLHAGFAAASRSTLPLGGVHHKGARAGILGHFDTFVDVHGVAPDAQRREPDA